MSLDLFEDRLDVDRYKDEESSGREKMLRVLRQAMQGELTERQQACVRLRYFDGKGLREVADEIGVTPPTASKHLKKARARLGKVMGYSFSRLN